MSVFGLAGAAAAAGDGVHPGVAGRRDVVAGGGGGARVRAGTRGAHGVRAMGARHVGVLPAALRASDDDVRVPRSAAVQDG